MPNSIDFLKGWHLLLAIVALIVLIISAGSDVRAAGQIREVEEFASQPEPGRFHKVIASPGLLEPDDPGISLWHDYGSFALYRVGDASLNALPPGIRKQIDIIDDPSD